MTSHNSSTAKMMGAAAGSVESCGKIAMRALPACRSALGLFQRYAFKRRIFLCGNPAETIDCDALCAGWPYRIVAAGSGNLFAAGQGIVATCPDGDPEFQTGNTSPGNSGWRQAYGSAPSRPALVRRIDGLLRTIARICSNPILHRWIPQFPRSA
jgi:hypothetical protein